MKEGKGLVKDYDNDGDLIYEGEYLNGLKNEKGKNYYKGKLIYEGQYLNGLRHGKGKEYYDDKLRFEGEYLYDRRLKGKEYVHERLDLKVII